jgi:hypothetical protein
VLFRQLYKIHLDLTLKAFVVEKTLPMILICGQMMPPENDFRVEVIPMELRHHYI